MEKEKTFYLLTTKAGLNDVLFWDVNLSNLGCLALFYTREEAEKYKQYLDDGRSEGVEVVIRQVEIKIK